MDNSGGHNPLEVAFYEKLIIAGPSRFKNAAEFDKLSHFGLIISCVDGPSLSHELGRFLALFVQNKSPLSVKQKHNIRAYLDEVQARPSKAADYVLGDIS